MIEFRKLTQEDLDYVRSRPFEKAVKDYPDMAVPDENCFTALFESAIIAVFGVQVRWEGRGIFWLILTDDCKKTGIHGIIGLRAIQDRVDELIKVNNLWRAEANIRVDFPEAIKMIEFLGFKCEATMEKFFPDKTDAFLYARII